MKQGSRCSSSGHETTSRSRPTASIDAEGDGSRRASHDKTRARQCESRDDQRKAQDAETQEMH